MNYHIIENTDAPRGEVRRKTVEVIHENDEVIWSYSELTADRIARNYQCQYILFCLNHNSPNPNILIMGVAGGSMASYIKLLLPNAKITAVDIDPDTTEICKQLGTIPDIDNLIIADACSFLENTPNETYDIIIQDIEDISVAEDKTHPVYKMTSDPDWIKANAIRCLKPDGIYLHSLEQFERDLYQKREKGNKDAQSWYNKAVLELTNQINGTLSYITAETPEYSYNHTSNTISFEGFLRTYTDGVILVFKNPEQRPSKKKVYQFLTNIKLIKKHPQVLHYLPALYTQQLVYSIDDILTDITHDKLDLKIDKIVNKQENKDKLLSFTRIKPNKFKV